jgi:uncharacterized protein YdeI (YjbR/CyaY-like superfamily)
VTASAVGLCGPETTGRRPARLRERASGRSLCGVVSRLDLIDRVSTLRMPPKTPTKSQLPILAPKSARAWEAWLERHHLSSAGVRLRLVRKGTNATTLTHPQALETALCFGWIDGQAQSHDSLTWLCRFTPRRRRSPWSQVNRHTALGLIRAGRMRAAGLQAVQAAKKDGRWKAAYAPQSRIQVPPDLKRELAREPRARSTFEELDRHSRFAIIYRLQTARLPETRQRRLRAFLDLLREGRSPIPPRVRKKSGSSRLTTA